MSLRLVNYSLRLPPIPLNEAGYRRENDRLLKKITQTLAITSTLQFLPQLSPYGQRQILQRTNSASPTYKADVRQELDACLLQEGRFTGIRFATGRLFQMASWVVDCVAHRFADGLLNQFRTSVNPRPMSAREQEQNGNAIHRKLFAHINSALENYKTQMLTPSTQALQKQQNTLSKGLYEATVAKAIRSTFYSPLSDLLTLTLRKYDLPNQVVQLALDKILINENTTPLFNSILTRHLNELYEALRTPDHRPATPILIPMANKVLIEQIVQNLFDILFQLPQPHCAARTLVRKAIAQKTLNLAMPNITRIIHQAAQTFLHPNYIEKTLNLVLSSISSNLESTPIQPPENSEQTLVNSIDQLLSFAVDNTTATLFYPKHQEEETSYAYWDTRIIDSLHQLSRDSLKDPSHVTTLLQRYTDTLNEIERQVDQESNRHPALVTYLHEWYLQPAREFARELSESPHNPRSILERIQNFNPKSIGIHITGYSLGDWVKTPIKTAVDNRAISIAKDLMTSQWALFKKRSFWLDCVMNPTARSYIAVK